MSFLRRSCPPARHPGKVVLFGATSPFGQTLSLLLKLSPHVHELHCCDTSPSVCGFVADLSHIDTPSDVRAVWMGETGGALVHPLESALRGAQCVLVCVGRDWDVRRAEHAAALRRVGAELECVFSCVARFSPKACVALLSGPLNATVPFAREVLQRHGAFDPRRLFGVTALDVHRTRAFVAGELGMNPFDVNVAVVGGRGGQTACPLIAQTGLRIPSARVMAMTAELQSFGRPLTREGRERRETPFTPPTLTTTPSGRAEGMECDVTNKEEEEEEPAGLFGAAPVDLSLASCALDWCVSLLKALRGDRGIVECALVESTMRREVPFFASRVELGTEGVEKWLPMGPLTPFEEECVEKAVPLLREDVEMGLEMAKQFGGGGVGMGGEKK